MLTGIVFGLAPALQSTRPDVVAALKDEAAGLGGHVRRLSLRNLLVVAQVALSILVLVGAGLCLRSLQKLLAVDAGFEPARVLLMSIDVALNGYEQPQGRRFYGDLVQRVSGLPGVESASLAAVVPFPGSMSRSVKIPGFDPPQGKPSNRSARVWSSRWARSLASGPRGAAGGGGVDIGDFGGQGGESVREGSRG